MASYRKALLDAKKLYKAKRYDESYELYTRLYERIPFDNSARYSYAWAIYQSKVKHYQSRNELLESAGLITTLTHQNDLNRVQLCVYTMSVFKVYKLLYEEEDYETLSRWLDKINPDLLDEVRHTSSERMYPSNREQYYIYASKTYLELGEYARCINASRRALDTLTRFTNDSAMWFQWRIAKSLRHLEDYRGALKYLKEVIKIKDDWYVLKEIAENYYFLEDYDKSLKFAVRAALDGGPMDMKFNLYTLLYDLLENSHPDYAAKHQELIDLIRSDDDTGKKNLEDELSEIWKRLDNQ